MRASASLLAITLILGFGLACRFSESLFGDDKSVLVNELWPDVPSFPGATKVDHALPLPARIITRTVMRGKASFISFRSDKPAQEVKDFYAGEQMKAAGWARSDENCFRDTKDTETGGALCMFTKGEQNQEMLGIMVQEQSANTLIFYMRMNMTQNQ